MSDISTLGLGQMGFALARSLVDGGHDVTVWNRSPAKAAPLVELGAALAPSVAAAVGASPVVLVCVDSYRTTRTLFDAADVSDKLDERVVLQLGTGTPREARDGEAWFTERGARYLDGGILGGPERIGTPAATILYSGQRSAFDDCEILLRSLAEDRRFVGEEVGSAAALDLAWLSAVYGTFAGTAHGVALCESEGVDLELYADVVAGDPTAGRIVDIVRANAFSNPGATLSVWSGALQRISDQAGDAGISPEVPDLVAGILDRAVAAGHGEEHIAAMVKVLRRARSS